MVQSPQITNILLRCRHPVLTNVLTYIIVYNSVLLFKQVLMQMHSFTEHTHRKKKLRQGNVQESMCIT